MWWLSQSQEINVMSLILLCMIVFSFVVCVRSVIKEHKQKKKFKGIACGADKKKYGSF